MNKTNDIDYDFINSIAKLTEEQHQSLICPRIIFESIEDDPTVINVTKEELSQWMKKNRITDVTDWYRKFLSKK